MAQMKQLHPLVETYLQNLKQDNDLGVPVPVSDVYFLGRLDMSEGTDDHAFISPTTAGLGKRMLSKLSSVYAMKFLPLGFAQMAVIDQDFQRKYYDFTFVRREFLGELRCIVLDVAPKKDAGKGRFLGRIWIEDQDYNIVRFNGTYSPHPRASYYLHFDSWRQNLRPGVWLPSLIYSEESDLKVRLGQHAALQGADAALGLQPEGPAPQLRVYRDHRRRTAIGPGPESESAGRFPPRSAARVGTSGGNQRA